MLQCPREIRTIGSSRSSRSSVWPTASTCSRGHFRHRRTQAVGSPSATPALHLVETLPRREREISKKYSRRASQRLGKTDCPRLPRPGPPPIHLRGRSLANDTVPPPRGEPPRSPFP